MALICSRKIKHMLTDQIKTVMRFWFNATRYNAQMMPIKVTLCDVNCRRCVRALLKQAEGRVKFNFATECIDIAAIL